MDYFWNVLVITASKDILNWGLVAHPIDPLIGTGNYSATSNNMKVVHWPLMAGLLHLVQRGADWVGPQPAQAPPRCTKCNCPPFDGQRTNHRLAV